MAIADHLFQEPEIGIVAHTSESQALHDQPLLAAWMRLTFQEKWPALMRVRSPPLAILIVLTTVNP